jgi:predicted amidohydrolase
MICADARLPEVPATLAKRGARMILQPTAWVNVGTPRRLWNPQPDYLIAERAREFGIPVASCSKWGIEGGTTFVGSSLVCDAGGNVLAQCGTGETGIAVAEVTPMEPQKPRVTAEERKRLLAEQTPALPSADVPPLRVALLESVAGVEQMLGGFDEERPDAPAIPTLLLSQAADVQLPATAQRAGGGNVHVLSRPSDIIHDVGGVCVAATSARGAVSFAPIRALALRGAHAVVVFGAGVRAATLRSRATENRVFVLHVTAAEVTAFGPRGDELGAVPAQRAASLPALTKAAMLTIHATDAADKEFAPRTNPFTARRPALYDF